MEYKYRGYFKSLVDGDVTELDFNAGDIKDAIKKAEWMSWNTFRKGNRYIVMKVESLN